ncbi:MAG: hypothetical protein HW388_751 [Dehalococcoidia bacterium]|nr:hypothetical protein [Dehalococcoidia bacterium]
MDFLGIGPTEILFTVIIALIVLGPSRMMEMARSLGKVVKEVRRTTRELPNLLSLEEEPGKSSSEAKGKGGAQKPGSDASGEEKPGEG